MHLGVNVAQQTVCFTSKIQWPVVYVPVHQR